MTTRKIFFPNLDGLRFIAFFAVFLAHSFFSKHESIQNELLYQKLREIGHLGIFGVNFFFVLSGFLITYLLLVEKERRRKIDISNFYIRRILKIWPLYYLIIIVGFLIIPISQKIIGNVDYYEQAELAPYLFFYNNFSSVIPSTAVLGVLWSIAVEEQFYFFWPIIIQIISTKKVVPFCLILIFSSIIIRTFWIDYGYTNTFSCMSDFAVGGLLAYLTFVRSHWLIKMKTMRRGWITLIYIIGALLFFFRSNWAEINFFYNNERLLFSLFFAFVILEQNEFQNSFVKWEKIKLLTTLGKYTYGLYMYHFIAIYIVSMILNKLHFNSELYQVVIVEPLLSLLLSIFIAHFSYIFFETRLLKLKSRFSQI